MVVSIALGTLIQVAITFETPGERLELFLSHLSQRSGEKLACPAGLKDEVIVAHFDNQPIEMVKSQLAFVLNATWKKKDDDIWWLSQSDDQKKEEKKSHRELRRTNLQTLIDKAKKAMPTKEWTIADAEDMERKQKDFQNRKEQGLANSKEEFNLYNLEPVSRLALSILGQLQPEVFPLDDLTPSFKVYSVRGPKQTIDLGEKFLPFIERFQREESLRATILSAEDTNPIPHSFIGITATKSPFPRIGFTLYNEGGEFERFWISTLLKLWGQADGEDFTISSDTQKVLDYIKRRSKNEEIPYDQFKTQITRFEEATQNPTLVDPLSLIQGPCWIDFSKNSKKPMIASLDDPGLNTTIGLYVPKIHQTTLCPGMTRVDRDGWILGRPVDPLDNRYNRCDRKELQFIASYSKNDTPTIEQQLDFVQISSELSLKGSRVPNANFLLDQDLLSYVATWTTAAFWTASKAGITPDAQTGILPVSSLTPQALDYLRAAYQQDLLLAAGGDMAGTAWSPIIYPEGLKGMYFQARWVQEQAFLAEDPNNPKLELSLPNFANYMKSNFDAESDLAKVHIQVGSRRALHLNFFTPKGNSDDEYSDPIKTDGITYTWETLPPHLKQLVKDEIARQGVEGSYSFHIHPSL